MRFKTGLVIGLGVGYVLGAKAGRERYEQIRGAFQQIAGSDRVSSVTAKGKSAVGNGLRGASQRIRAAADGHTEQP